MGTKDAAPSVVSCGVDALLAESWSRRIPAACSSSVIALLLGACCIECEVDGRRTGVGSGTLTDATEFAVEFFLALDDSARSAAPVVALLMAKFAASGEEAGGGE